MREPSGAAVAPRKSNPSGSVARLLSALLPTSLLGERLPLDFYARIGFRFLAIPARTEASVVAAHWQRFRSLLKVSPDRALSMKIRTIPDEHLKHDDVFAAVAALENPRHRFIAELFWPDLSEEDFSILRTSLDLTAAPPKLGGST